MRLWGIHQILELARGQRNQENQLAEVLTKLSKVEGFVLSSGLKVDNSQPVGGQDKQESQVAELSGRLSKVEGLVVNLGIKVDQVIHRLDEFGKSMNDVVEVAKAVNAMGKVLAKSLQKEASPTGSDQNPPSKRRRV